MSRGRPLEATARRVTLFVLSLLLARAAGFGSSSIQPTDDAIFTPTGSSYVEIRWNAGEAVWFIAGVDYGNQANQVSLQNLALPGDPVTYITIVPYPTGGYNTFFVNGTDPSSESDTNKIMRVLVTNANVVAARRYNLTFPANIVQGVSNGNNNTAVSTTFRTPIGSYQLGAPSSSTPANNSVSAHGQDLVLTWTFSERISTNSTPDWSCNLSDLVYKQRAVAARSFSLVGSPAHEAELTFASGTDFDQGSGLRISCTKTGEHGPLMSLLGAPWAGAPSYLYRFSGSAFARVPPTVVPANGTLEVSPTLPYISVTFRDPEELRLQMSTVGSVRVNLQETYDPDQPVISLTLSNINITDDSDVRVWFPFPFRAGTFHTITLLPDIARTATDESWPASNFSLTYRTAGSSFAFVSHAPDVNQNDVAANVAAITFQFTHAVTIDQSGLVTVEDLSTPGAVPVTPTPVLQNFNKRVSIPVSFPFGGRLVRVTVTAQYAHEEHNATDVWPASSLIFSFSTVDGPALTHSFNQANQSTTFTSPLTLTFPNDNVELLVGPTVTVYDVNRRANLGSVTTELTASNVLSISFVPLGLTKYRITIPSNIVETRELGTKRNLPAQILYEATTAGPSENDFGHTLSPANAGLVQTNDPRIISIVFTTQYMLLNTAGAGFFRLLTNNTDTLVDILPSDSRVTVSGKTVSVDVAAFVGATWRPGMHYTATFKTGFFVSESGETWPPNDLSWSFKVDGRSFDITSVEPAANSQVVPPIAAIFVDFNEKIDGATITGSATPIEIMDLSTPGAVAYNPSYPGDVTAANNTRASVSVGSAIGARRRVRVTIPGQYFRSFADGTVTAPETSALTWFFTTLGTRAFDEEYNPSNNTRLSDVSNPTQFNLSFPNDNLVLTSDPAKHVRIRNLNQRDELAALNFSDVGNSPANSIQFSQQLTAGVGYTISVDQDFVTTVDGRGFSVPQGSWRVLTPSVTAPDPTDVFPANASHPDSITLEIRLPFGSFMKPNTGGGAGTLTLHIETTSSSIVKQATQMSFSGQDVVLSLSPDLVGWGPGYTYTAVITEAFLLTENDDPWPPTGQTYSWTWSINMRAIYFSSRTPDDDTSNVALGNTDIRLQFSEPVALLGPSVIIRDLSTPGASPVQPAPSLEDSERRVRVPYSATGGRLIEVEVPANYLQQKFFATVIWPLSTMVWRFSTGSAPALSFTLNPVNSSSPTANAADTSATITFVSDVVEMPGSPPSVTVFDENKQFSVALTSAPSLDSGGTILTISFPRNASTRYRVSVPTGLVLTRELTNKRSFPSSFNWTFVTAFPGTYEHTVAPAAGTQIETTVARRIRLNFTEQYMSKGTGSFTLYNFNLDTNVTFLGTDSSVTVNGLIVDVDVSAYLGQEWGAGQLYIVTLHQGFLVSASGELFPQTATQTWNFTVAGNSFALLIGSLIPQPDALVDSGALSIHFPTSERMHSESGSAFPVSVMDISTPGAVAQTFTLGGANFDIAPNTRSATITGLTFGQRRRIVVTVPAGFFKSLTNQSAIAPPTDYVFSFTTNGVSAPTPTYTPNDGVAQQDMPLTTVSVSYATTNIKFGSGTTQLLRIFNRNFRTEQFSASRLNPNLNISAPSSNNVLTWTNIPFDTGIFYHITMDTGLILTADDRSLDVVGNTTWQVRTSGLSPITTTLSPTHLQVVNSGSKPTSLTITFNQWLNSLNASALVRIFILNEGTFVNRAWGSHVTVSDLVLSIFFGDVLWKQGYEYWVTVDDRLLQTENNQAWPPTGSPFGGVGEWNFSVTGSSLALVSMTPASGTLNVANTTTSILFVFSERVKPGTGNIVVNDLSTPGGRSWTYASTPSVNVVFSSDEKNVTVILGEAIGGGRRVTVDYPGGWLMSYRDVPVAVHTAFFVTNNPPAPTPTYTPNNAELQQDMPLTTVSVSYATTNIKFGSGTTQLLRIFNRNFRTEQFSASRLNPNLSISAPSSNNVLTWTNIPFDTGIFYHITMDTGLILTADDRSLDVVGNTTWQVRTSGLSPITTTLSPTHLQVVNFGSKPNSLTITFNQWLLHSNTAALVRIFILNEGTFVNRAWGSQVTVSDLVMSVSFTDVLWKQGYEYWVSVDEGLLQTENNQTWPPTGSPFGGVGVWNFSVTGSSLALVSMTPTPSSTTATSTTSQLVFVFSERVKRGTGNLFVNDLSTPGGRSWTFAAATSANITFSGDEKTVTVSFGAPIGGDRRIELNYPLGWMMSYRDVPVASFSAFFNTDNPPPFNPIYFPANNSEINPSDGANFSITFPNTNVQLNPSSSPRWVLYNFNLEREVIVVNPTSSSVVSISPGNVLRWNAGTLDPGVVYRLNMDNDYVRSIGFVPFGFTNLFFNTSGISLVTLTLTPAHLALIPSSSSKTLLMVFNQYMYKNNLDLPGQIGTVSIYLRNLDVTYTKTLNDITISATNVTVNISDLPFSAGYEFTVTISPRLLLTRKDQRWPPVGSPFGGEFEWRFVIQGSSLAIVNRDPGVDQQGIDSSRANIIFSYNERVFAGAGASLVVRDLSTVGGRDFTIPSSSVVFSANNFNATVTLPENFRGGRKMQVEVPTGFFRNIRDVHSANLTWLFYTDNPQPFSEIFNPPSDPLPFVVLNQAALISITFPNSNIELSVSQAPRIALYNRNLLTQITANASSPLISISPPNRLNWNLTSFQPGTRYHIVMDAGFVRTVALQNYSITSNTTWSFRTCCAADPVPIYTPTFENSSVNPGSTSFTFTMNFAQVMIKNVSGTIVITDLNLLRVTNLTSNVAVVLSGNDMIASFSRAQLDVGTRYLVNFPDLALENLAGFVYRGTSTWSFVTSGTFTPNIVATTPAHLADNLAIPSQLIIDYNQRLRMDHPSRTGTLVMRNMATGQTCVFGVGSSFVVYTDRASGPDTQGRITVTLSPCFIRDGDAYEVTISANFFFGYNDAGTPALNANSYIFILGNKQPLTIDSRTPALDDRLVAPATNSLSILFSEAVRKPGFVAGTVNVLSWTFGTNITIPCTSTSVSISNATVTVTLGTALQAASEYFVEISSTCFQTFDNISFPGITGTLSWNFWTSGGAPPVMTIVDPPDNSLLVAPGFSQLRLNFDASVFINPGKRIFIWDRSAISNVTEYLVQDIATSVDPAQYPTQTKQWRLTITPLIAGHVYYVLIESDTFRTRVNFDGSRTALTWAGITADTVWSFTLTGGAFPAPALTPADDSFQVSAGRKLLELQFTDNRVFKRTDLQSTTCIDINNDSDQSQERICLDSVRIVTSEDLVTINLNTPVSGGKHYNVIIPPGAFVSFNSRYSFAGFTSRTNWNFIGDLVCEAGSATIGGACQVCQRGTYSATDGATECTTCEAGTFNTNNGSTSCQSCPTGRFKAAQTLQNECDVCAPGRFAEFVRLTRCSDCQAGSFTNDSTQSQCILCPAGTVQSATGRTSCSPCAAGTFSDQQGMTGCRLCPPGTFTNTSGSTQCVLCDPGTFRDTSGATDCQRCSLGTVTLLPGLRVCDPCPAGRFEVNRMTCEPCANGTAQATPGSIRCQECQPGRFALNLGSVTCEPCPRGRSARNNAQIQCDECDAGKYQDLEEQTRCNDCPEGFFANGTGMRACEECAAGKFARLPAAAFCDDCEPGRVSRSPQNGTGISSCSACVPGRFASTPGRIFCSLCPLGRFAAFSAMSICTECAVGRFEDTMGSTECKVCTSGSAVNPGSDACLTCLPGNFFNGTSGRCQDCAAGRFQSQSGATDCIPCTQGKFQSSAGALDCTACGNGEYGPSNIIGLATCLQCVPGKISVRNPSLDFGPLTCTDCPVGRNQPLAQQGACLDCVPGRFANVSGTPVCLLCDPGTFQPNSSATRCVNCPVGTYADRQGSDRCTPCLPGRYMPFEGRSQCIQCETGRFANISSLTTCIQCETGKFADRQGSELCTPCNTGRFARITGVSECDNCDEGRFAPTVGMSECTPCPIGEFTSIKGSSVCSDCSAGRFSDQTGRTVCQECQLGRFNNRTGRTECDLCDVRTEMRKLGATVCDLCLPGRFSNVSGLQECYECPAGQFQNLGGQSQCVDCDEGKFSESTGFAECDLCPLGQFNNRTGQRQCELCAQGRSTNVLGTVNCPFCSLGRFANTERTFDCTPCSPGEFASTNGSVQCQGCPEGQYQNETGQSGCRQCEPGKFTSTAGREICSDCPRGRFTNEFGQRQCMACEKGTAVSNVGALQCDPCAPGTYAAEDGQVTCNECPTGRFFNSTGASECSLCTTGNYQNEEGKTSCKKCPLGRFSDVNGRGECLVCLAGSYAPQEGLVVCINCEPGRFQPTAESTDCIPCSEGKIAPTSGRTDCILCPLGEFANRQGMSACEKCPPGTRSPDGLSTLCENCTAGMFTSESGQASCKPCDDGFFASNEGASECRRCDPGRFSVKSGQVGATICTNCSAGSFQSAEARQSCILCPRGRYGNVPGMRICTPCEQGRFQNESGAIDCVRCPRGTFQSKIGQQSCNPCEPGAFSSIEGADICTSCSRGTYSPRESSRCLECEAGTFADESGLSSCKPCTRGKFSPQAGPTEACLNCPPGRFQPNDSAVDCLNCPAGEMTGEAGRDFCTPCTSGQFAGSAGESTCSPCAPGRFSPQSVVGIVACTNCLPGTFSETSGKQDCTECQKGRFAPEAGLSTCVPCAQGTFQNATASTTCDPCESGKYIGDTGKDACIPCQAGRFTARTGAPTCDDCPPGRFANFSGATVCSLCEPGKANSEFGKSTCIECDSGKHANRTGLSSCENCPLGRHSKQTSGGDNLPRLIIECDVCVHPLFSEQVGLEDCERCPDNQYRKAGNVNLSRQCTNDACREQYKAVCVPCPPFGAVCSGGVIRALLDYYISFDQLGSATVHSCPENLCGADGQCTFGRKNATENPLCGECKDGYWPSGNTCVLCDGYNWPNIIMFVIMVWVGVLGLTLVARPQPMDAAYFDIIIYHLQMGMLFLGPINQWSSWLSVFNLDVTSITSRFQGGESKCVAQLTPYGNFVIRLAAPICMVFLLILVMGYTKLYYKHRWQSWNHIRTFMSVCLFIYVPVTDTVLRYLNCIQVGERRVVASAPAIDCDSPRYQQWGAVVYFTLVTFVAGVPVALLIFLYHFEKKGMLQENAFKHRYGVLYDRFKSETYWWVVVTLVRRTILVALAAFLPIRGERFALISFFQLLFTVMQVHWKPYLLPSENNMAFISLAFLLILTISLGSFEFPYKIAVSAFITFVVMVPAMGFACYLAYEKLRQTFRPTEEEKRILKEFKRSLRRGRKAFRKKIGDDILADEQRAADEDGKKKKKKKKKSKKDKKNKDGDDAEDGASEAGESTSGLKKRSSSKKAKSVLGSITSIEDFLSDMGGSAAAANSSTNLVRKKSRRAGSTRSLASVGESAAAESQDTATAADTSTVAALSTENLATAGSVTVRMPEDDEKSNADSVTSKGRRRRRLPKGNVLRKSSSIDEE